MFGVGRERERTGPFERHAAQVGNAPVGVRDVGAHLGHELRGQRDAVVPLVRHIFREEHGDGN